MLNSVYWGNLKPGESITKKVYVKNVGNTWQQWTVTTENWVPSTAKPYFTFTTNYLQTWTVPQDTLEIQFTLLVSPSIRNVTDFSFNIVVSGT